MISGSVEILAPAGSYDCFRAAIAAGADAVYAGGSRFGARAYADNFSGDELIQAIEEAHLFGKRLYLTVNTLLKDRETEELDGYLRPLYERGLDAVIVQDAGVLQYIRERFPGLEIHASTQMTITGYPGASFLEEAGVKRVVPARELSLDEIRQIRQNTNMEIECFVHGALCYCYSGQCLLSSMIGGRSGNRGQCAQPCRLPWTVSGRQKYYMSLKDMCALELIPDLVDAGIDSFKIEGRMKKPEYVAAVTSVYRRYTDLYLEKGREGFRVAAEDREMLMDLYNRGGSHTGYYRQHNGSGMLSPDRPNHAGVPALKVERCRGRKIEGTALTDINPGDVIETGKGKKNNYTAGCRIKKGDTISFLLQKGVAAEPGAILPRIRNESLIQSLRQKYLEGNLQAGVEGRLILACSQPAVLEVSCRGCSFSAHSSCNVQKAENRPLDAEQVKKRLAKTGGTDFCFRTLEICMDGDVFLPVQELNQMRRTALDGLRQKLISAFYRADGKENRSVLNKNKDESRCTDAAKQELSGNGNPFGVPALTVLAETLEQLVQISEYLACHPGSRIRRVYAECHMDGNFYSDKKTAEILKKIRSVGCQVYPAMPRIFRKKERERFEGMQKDFAAFPQDGVLVRNYEEVWMLRQCGFDKNIILDHNLYVFNRCAKQFWSTYGITDFTAPVELCAEELAGLGLDSAELIVYGRLPVMVSAQCISAAASRCRRRSGIICIEDRFQNRYPVKNYCDSCYSIIYDTCPVYLGNQEAQLRSLAPKALRIQFSTETGKEILEILSLFEQMDEKNSSGRIDFEYTQGHFKKGIK